MSALKLIAGCLLATWLLAGCAEESQEDAAPLLNLQTPQNVHPGQTIWQPEQ